MVTCHGLTVLILPTTGFAGTSGRPLVTASVPVRQSHTLLLPTAITSLVGDASASLMLQSLRLSCGVVWL